MTAETPPAPTPDARGSAPGIGDVTFLAGFVLAAAVYAVAFRPVAAPTAGAAE